MHTSAEFVVPSQLPNRESSRLSAAFVKAVKPARRLKTYGDGRGGFGLTLCVQPNGVKFWTQRIRITGRPTNIGLGGYPLVTLAKAREVALANARTARDGGDPRTRKPAVPTVAQAVEAIIERDAPTWRNAEIIAREIRNALHAHTPSLVNLRVDKVTSAQCVAALKPLWNAKRETGMKIRQRLSAVFKLAIAEGHRADNPIDAAAAALPKRRGDAQRRRNQTALPYAEVAHALAVVERSAAWVGQKLAFRFLVLTAARNGEVCGATWPEIDADAALWVVPPDRMKAGVEHRVPLSTQAMEVLAAAAPMANGNGLVFPARRGGPINRTTISNLMRDLGIAAVPHGFRSSFRDWAAEQTAAPRAVMEAALAHQVSNHVEAAYFRSDLLEKRQELMQQWADYITRPEDARAR